jgi:predicted acetyltransferase
MTVEIRPASSSDKHILRNLMELYLHDFSEFEDLDVDEHGLYGYERLDHYWLEAERHPFLIRVAGKLAGFILVRDSRDQPVTHSIAEFFVVRKYRRQGVGRLAAWAMFDQFPGAWNVCQEETNRPAQAFWRKVIGEYTRGNYAEEQLDTTDWHGPCQKFQSRTAI